MGRLAATAGIAAVAMAGCAAGTGADVAAPGPSPTVSLGVVPEPTIDLSEVEVVVQSSEAALRSDLELIAEANGWTFEEASERSGVSDALGDVAGDVAEQRPDKFIGSSLPGRDGQPPRPTLYIKGPVDEFVAGVVLAAPIDIDVVSNQPYNRDELDERISIVGNALTDLGYQDMAVGAPIDKQGRVEVELGASEGLSTDPQAIIAQLPEPFRGAVDIVVYAPDGTTATEQ